MKVRKLSLYVRLEILKQYKDLVYSVSDFRDLDTLHRTGSFAFAVVDRLEIYDVPEGYLKDSIGSGLMADARRMYGKTEYCTYEIMRAVWNNNLHIWLDEGPGFADPYMWYGKKLCSIPFRSFVPGRPDFNVILYSRVPLRFYPCWNSWWEYRWKYLRILHKVKGHIGLNSISIGPFQFAPRGDDRSLGS